MSPPGRAAPARKNPFSPVFRRYREAGGAIWTEALRLGGRRSFPPEQEQADIAGHPTRIIEDAGRQMKPVWSQVVLPAQV